VHVFINGVLAKDLTDTGAKSNHIALSFIRRAHLAVQISKKVEKVVLAVKGSAVATKGICSARVQLCKRTYDNVKFTVMNGLLWDMILGREFLKLHESVQFNFGVPEQSLQLGVLKTLKCPNPVRLFEHMTPDCHPIAANSRTIQKLTKSSLKLEYRSC